MDPHPFSLATRYTFDGREDGPGFLQLQPPRIENPFFFSLPAISEISPAVWKANLEISNR